MSLQNVMLLVLLLLALPSSSWPQTGRKRVEIKDGSARMRAATDWPAYGRDPGGSRYSPLAQVNRANVKYLKVAWTYRTGDINVQARSARNAAFEATPILVDGTLYLSTPFSRVIALDPETGKQRWAYDPKVDLSLNYSEVTSRGVSTWVDSEPNAGAAARRRIFVATLDARLCALDATTGAPCKDFGQDGQVDLTRDVRLTKKGQYQVTSPPAVIGDLVIVGSSMGDNRGVEVERGVVRAYDARTGTLRWRWDPIPQDEKDPARKSWKGAGAGRTGAANAWSIISADPARDLIFIPTSSPSPDFYGVERIGSNLYANSVVALRASTGKVIWHFQVVHHDLWDYDVAAQPMLITVKRNGRDVPAVVVGTKMGHIFILHRETGKSLFPIEERAVPRSNVPGEETSPTQPFPVLPRPISPSRLAPDDAWGATPADRDWCRDRIKALRSEGIFTPPSFEGTVMFPGNVGGINWGGMAYDAKRGLLVTSTNRLATVVRLIPRREFEELKKSGEGNRLQGEFGLMSDDYLAYREPLRAPGGAFCNPPPWGALTAINLSTGAVRWEVPLGTIPQLSSARKSSEWGSINLGGAIVTAGGLVFIAATMDNYIRAFDVETGKELWKAELPASAQATPMTYSIGDDGKQYLVVAAGGHGKLGTAKGDYVVAFALP
ncbi:MAG TPA: pyrroloquinoline quinone-dependent dehydrogenase [Blastocatellia bacterium]|jgi:quinoprotein glucose dehydrogenase